MVSECSCSYRDLRMILASLSLGSYVANLLSISGSFAVSFIIRSTTDLVFSSSLVSLMQSLRIQFHFYLLHSP
jgi:hypothetical protein